MRLSISEEDAVLANRNLDPLVTGTSAVQTSVKKELNSWKTVLVAFRLKLNATQDKYSMKKASAKTARCTQGHPWTGTNAYQ
jgi:hypothetical protein